MLVGIVVGLFLLFILQKFGIYSFIISSFVGGFLSKKMINGAVVGLVIFGVGIFLINFSLHPTITSAFLIPKVSSIKLPILCASFGLIGGLFYKIFK